MFRDHEDAVRTDAEMAVADESDAFRRQLECRVHHEVIVAESVRPDEINVHDTPAAI